MILNNICDMDVEYVFGEYYDWLIDRILHYNRYEAERNKKIEPPFTYYDLLFYLHNTNYVPFFEDDEHRYEDGLALRERFSIITNVREEEEEILMMASHCSMLEMMVALSLKCEEQIMYDPEYGNRTKQWFWGMIRSLGLNKYHDIYIHEHPEAVQEIKDILFRFMNNAYEPTGEGGLFTVPKIKENLSEQSIWYQLMRYLDTLP